MAHRTDELLEAFSRGRNDPAYFAKFFLGRTLHDGQAEFVLNANAKVNALACANRWGKTTMLAVLHYHSGIYKYGGTDRYMNEDGTVDMDRFTKLPYRTVHTAGEWEQAALVWEDALKLESEQAKISAFVQALPKSKPPHILGINGWKWEFRTLGVNASNIDGKSIYDLTIDEAGWIDNLDEMMRNVLRVRTADVQGRIHIVGTFKPGISRDFYKICVRASAYTGRAIGFAHGSADEESQAASNLDLAIEKYLKDFGIDLSEYQDALNRSIRG